MNKQYEQIETVYNTDIVNTFLSRGWELIGEPTNGTDPETGMPAPCFTLGKPKPSPSVGMLLKPNR
ncbi:hypothetical protein [Pseudomonas congelans]|uniref:hypothetical protein n=1 Tax=Pseudomonas TaxID=286 RepID=UPI001BDC8573|nr:hypothetical protein [Pseudomonas congelans]QVX12786.1 hypothetical protein DBV21_24390 [Pseudomonas congelans]